MSDDASMLVIVGPLLLAAILIFLLSVHIRSRLLFRWLREQLDPELWQALGAPESIIEEFRDAERRWREFVRSGEYRRRLSRELVERIDDNRRRNRRMLVIFAIAIVLLAYRFWPLLTSG
jgi:hypothetical protein